MELVYWSSKTGNTHRFMEKLGLPCTRLPMVPAEDPPAIAGPFVLVVPTYGHDARSAVPLPVEKFLAAAGNAGQIRGVIAGGNRNFGATYCLAGRLLAARFKVPLIHSFELAGMPGDHEKVRSGLETFWTR